MGGKVRGEGVKRRRSGARFGGGREIKSKKRGG